MEKNQWLSHAEFIILLVTLIGVFYNLDYKIERCTSAQAARTDKLYEMFIELIKENRK
jgi:hypothetical protein